MEQQEAPKFLVIETGDVDYSLSKIEVQQLAHLLKKIGEGRTYVGKDPLSGIFVPADAPMYGSVVELVNASEAASEE